MRNLAKLLLPALLLLPFFPPFEADAQNLPPEEVMVYECTQPMQPVIICMSPNDPEGDNIHIDEEATHTTFNCSLVYLSDTCFRYTPLPGFTGTDTVFVHICDDGVPPACSISRALVYIGCGQPQANGDVAIISDNSLNFNGIETAVDPTDGIFLPVTGNDIDPCGGELLVSQIIEQPEHGTLELALGQLVYTPESGYVGSDQFVYQACNDCPNCETAVVNIGVNLPDTCSTDEVFCMAPFTGLELCPQFCDIPADEIEEISVSVTAGSIMPGTNNCYTYIPPPVSEEVEKITFTACNTDGFCQEQLICVTIDAACGEQPPVAVNDTVNALLGETILVPVLSNDYDPDGQPIALAEILEGPQCGTAEAIGPSISYTSGLDCGDMDFLTYVICDSTGLKDTATVVFNLSPDCGNFQSEYCTPSFLSPVEICVEFCSLLGSDEITIEEAHTTFDCSITVLNESCLQYTPLPGFVGIDSVNITACNELGVCETVTVAVHVGCVEPQAVDDSAEVTNTQAETIDVLTNDTHPCGEPMNVILLNAPENGTAAVNAGNQIVYSANEGYFGLDEMSYLACVECSGNVLCDTAIVNLVVNDDPSVTNHQPIANDDSADTPVGEVIVVPILANDTDPDNTDPNPNNDQTLTPSIVTPPQNGMASIDPVTGELTYTPNPGFEGVDTIVYELCDDGEPQMCDQATVVVEVYDPASLALDAEPDVVYTNQNQPVSFNVLANDAGDNVYINEITDNPDNGALSGIVPASGMVTYQPNFGFNGIDYFTYEVCDDNGICQTTLVTVIVLPAGTGNLPPLTNNDVAETPANEPVVIDVLDNDTDPNNDPLEVSGIVAPPGNGTASITPDGEVSYEPDAGFEGCDLFEYEVCDDSGACATAWVQVQVGDADCLNNPPLAQDDAVQTYENMAVEIDAMGNDTDPENTDDDSGNDQTLSLELISAPVHGTAAPLSNGSGFVYLPESGFVGNDYFAYTLCDDGVPPLCDTAYVAIEVLPVPIDAEPDIVTTPENTPIDIDILQNDFGTGIELNAIVSNPDFGELTVNPITGMVNYAPDTDFVGTDYFEYQICSDILDECDLTLVTINVLPDSITNLPPVAANDLAETPLGEAVAIDVLENDFDPFGGDALVIASVGEPANGTATTNPAGEIVYTPNPGTEAFVDSFIYVVCDNGVPPLCDTALVVVNVGGDDTAEANEPPLAGDDMANTSLNMPVDIDVMENDEDPNEGDVLTITLITPPAHGTADDEDGDGIIAYTPEDGFTGTDFFAYVVCDNGLPELCDTGYVTVLVDGGDATVINVQTPEETPVEICIDDYVSGIAIDTIAVVTTPDDGGLVITDCVEYYPSGNFTGEDQTLLQVCDANDDCIDVIINITVTPVPDPPVANDDAASTPQETPVVVDVMGNDTDPDDDLVLTPIVIEGAQNGTAIPSGNADGTVEYAPDAGFVGVDSFRYVIFDATGLSDTAWAVITVTEGSDELEVDAINDFASTEMNEPVDIDVVDNDLLPADAVAGSVVATLVDEPANGMATVDGEVFTYTPDFGFVGTDVFTYELCVEMPDGIILCDTAQVTVSVLDSTAETCDPPVFANFITPNGDEMNDLFIVENADQMCFNNTDLVLLIFNRWGDEVYRNTDYSNADAWNGNWQNTGKPVPDGTYFYTLTYPFDGEQKQYSGFLEVIR